MDVSKSIDLERLFGAKDLVVVITGGGTGNHNINHKATAHT
jgi:hypothetical protein